MVHQLRKRIRQPELVQPCQGERNNCIDYRPSQLVRTDSTSSSISQGSQFENEDAGVYLLPQTSTSNPEAQRIAPAWLGDPSEFMRTITRAINGEVPAASNNARHQLPTIIATKDICCGKDHVCTLCFEAVEEGEVLTRLPCGHMFHKGIDRHVNNHESDIGRHSECRGILRWLKNNNTCPQCRVPLEAEQVPFVKIQQEVQCGRQQFYAIPVPIVVPILHMQRQMIRRQNALIRNLQQENEVLRTVVNQKKSVEESKSIETHGDDGAAKKIVLDTIESVKTSSTDASNESDTGASPYTWQCPAKDFIDRMKIVVDVMEAARKMHLEARSGITHQVHNTPQQVEQKLYLLAKKMEAYMYRSAPSKESYLNRETLEQRLTSTINKWGIFLSQRGISGSSVPRKLFEDFEASATPRAISE